MKPNIKVGSFLLAIVMMFSVFAIAGCTPTTLNKEWSYKTSDNELAIGVYIYSLNAAYSQAESFAKKLDDYDSTSDKWLDEKIKDDDGNEQVAREWIKDQAKKMCLSYLVVDEQLKKENAELREQLVDYLDAKEENAKLIIDGKEVTNDYEFTADKENMEVQIEFTFDGSTLGRKQLVTFEELYDITNPEEPKKVTEHKEINDEGQTVTIKEVPGTPTPETPGTTTKTSNPPKTEDTANAILWIAILVLSAAGITGVRIWNKKKQVKRLGIEEKKEEEE